MSLRRADHPSRGVLLTVVRRCVWSRNLTNEEAMTHVGSQSHSKIKCFLIAQHVSGDTPPIIRSSKTLIAASSFTYVFSCRPLRWLSHRSGRQPQTCVKPEAAITVFELLMMGSVSPEACWTIKKHWNNKFYYTVASCWFFLWDLYYDARIYEHQVKERVELYLYSPSGP